MAKPAMGFGIMTKTLSLPFSLGPRTEAEAPAADPAADAVDETEARMRRALGLEARARRAAPGAGRTEERGRRRFAPEPEAVDGRLAQAIAGREQAEQALRQAQETIRDLRTKLGHTELARDEAMAALKVARSPEPAAPKRVAATKPREPQPVKWWLSSGAKGPGRRRD